MLSIPAGDTVRDIPFRVLVLGNFGADKDRMPDGLRDRPFVPLTFEDFDAAVRAVSPQLSLMADNKLADDDSQIAINLRFRALKDFEPACVAANVPALQRLMDQLADSSTSVLARRDQRELRDRIDQQIFAIMHHPDFKALEGAWRGVHYLAAQSKATPGLMIELVDCSQQELAKDFEHAQEMEDSWLFDVCQREFESLDGVPISMIVGDFKFTHAPVNIDLLRHIAEVAADAQCPFLSNAEPELFGLESWNELHHVTNVASIFTSAEYAAWRTLCNHEASRFLCLALPEVLARHLFVADAEAQPGSLSSYDEDQVALASGLHMPLGDVLSTMNAACALAARIVRSYNESGWFAELSGPDGGQLNDLTMVRLPFENLPLMETCTPSLRLSPHSAQELTQLRFALVFIEHGRVYFSGVPSLHKPKQYEGTDGELATLNNLLASQLPFLLTVGRIAHAVRLLALHLQSDGHSQQEQENRINAWGRALTHVEDQSLVDDKPLEDFGVELVAVPNNPGFKQVNMLIRPRLSKPMTAPIRTKFVV